MPRKAVDQRIPALIRNGVQEKKRSFFVVVGDRSKDVIVHLHYIATSMGLPPNGNILWAYKNKLLNFTSHKKKRENKIKKEIKRGIRNANDREPFELFVAHENIRYTYYKETEKILGNTFKMCILQDFEAMTPNILARTVETVEGGGLVVMLLKGMNSLKQLYTMTMDVHTRYRTEAHHDVVARFNERFILSLGACDSCLVIDDELNVLPISGGKGVVALPPPPAERQKTPSEKELDDLKESLRDTEPVGSLVALAKTVDQGRALLTFVDAISEKTLRSTVTLTAARGRGKSAALGVSIAAAVAHGYSNIFVTSPSPENLKALFEFIFKGFDALTYQDGVDYSIIQSTNPDFNKAIVRVNIHRQHRQTIQYIRPQDAHVLGQAELLVIDEAAAIPLPLVRRLMGPYLVFMASTINGYEGTGRSLSLKLIKQLREQAYSAVSNGDESEVADRSTGRAAKYQETGAKAGRTLREITLSEPIRYAQGDSVEKWLTAVLCLDATMPKSKLASQGCPDPSQCELLNVNRDTLFSFHPVSEKFLQQMVSLYVASHYKNTPDDLQLMSDAPGHELFVLVPPVSEDSNRLPEPLCVVQVSLEGKISKQSVLNSLSRGQRPSGDLIPWLISQQFQDEDFASLSGARVVRIATNPDYVSMGYGSKALELIVKYYEGKFTDLSEDTDVTMEESMTRVSDAELADANLLDDNIKVRDISKMPPLFAKLTERRPARLDYVGVSYGLTKALHKFWKRADFMPVYLRQTANDLTGEHTCVMLRTLDIADGQAGLSAYARDFQGRFLRLLAYHFKSFPAVLALSIDESANTGAQQDPDTNPNPLTKHGLDSRLSPYDIKRLDSYASNMLDHHVITDLLPIVAMLYFSGKIKSGVKLTGVQQAILLAVGLQHREVGDIATELGLQSSQLLAMFIKILRKITAHFNSLLTGEVQLQMDKESKPSKKKGKEAGMVVSMEPHQTSLEEDMELDEQSKARRKIQRELIDSLPLDQYEIDGDGSDWDIAEKQVAKAATDGKSGAVVSVKSKKPKRKADQTARDIHEEFFGDKKRKKQKKGKQEG
ncbi:hypothetical protein MKZ38_009142 [Zalerion maritima]|uniref:RNA cytidine acetyltransferase n=1 Tax=Zalerion maritima TaxID=339359 RepID=A0AAD5RHD8_9PEZI|nr:hypothetical protein MKZ38_009142 [Zalerion maritima]